MQTAWIRMRCRVTGSKLFDTQKTFSPTLSRIKALRKFKQTIYIAVDNLFGGLRVNTGFSPDQSCSG